MNQKHIIRVGFIALALLLNTTTGCMPFDPEERQLQRDLEPTVALMERLRKLSDRKATKEKWEAEAIGGTGKAMSRSDTKDFLKLYEDDWNPTTVEKKKAHWIGRHDSSEEVVLYQFPALFKGLVFFDAKGKAVDAFLTVN